MQQHVIVSFGKDGEYDFKATGGGAADEARQWFEREFEALKCDVTSPTGKILAVDRILSVAKYAGVERFRGKSTWARQFAKHTAAVLGRELIRVDVEHYSIGY
ncbi:MAG: hypothetical protein FWF20_09865 [Betaproteobacteria bacterium]|nr:hypothetical protein [Betaproteobacteria bacterium]MCL2887067.1 hypothetical protein [Betaproteobacteria bacterium]